MCPFDNAAFAVNGKVKDPFSWFNHTSWVAVVTPTDRPKSVRNRCVIEVFMLSRRFLDFSVVVGAFVIGLSQISSFFLTLFLSILSLSVCAKMQNQTTYTFCHGQS